MMKGLGVGLLVVMISGCTGSAGIRARSYVTDKQRVDQRMEGGNFGYFHGKPAPEDRSKFKKTRRIYVLEITKDVEELEEREEEAAPAAQSAPSSGQPTADSQRPLPDWEKSVDIPSFEDAPAVEPRPRGETGFVEYTVQKEDTLQKISKKFYDTYRQWPRIYEANKDVIPDPDRIKPGITLRVPVE